MEQGHVFLKKVIIKKTHRIKPLVPTRVRETNTYTGSCAVDKRQRFVETQANRTSALIVATSTKTAIAGAAHAEAMKAGAGVGAHLQEGRSSHAVR